MHSSLLLALWLVALFAAKADAMRSPSFDEKNLKVFSSMGLKKEWKAFKDRFDKSYSTAAEEKRRKKIFAHNLKEIEAHNGDSFTLGINPYSDMKTSEFVKKMTGYKRPASWDETRSFQFADSDDSSLPDKIDWIAEGYVTPVKNQKNCGSCYAFSVTGTLEGQNFKKTGKLVSLSEQQIVDCSSQDRGCRGGWPQYTYDYIAMNGGIDSEESYPYEAAQGPCKFSNSTVGATCTGYMGVDRSESALMEAVAEIGPIGVAINVDLPSFKQYEDGVYNDPACITGNPNHAVLVVGYGETPTGTKYWVVKNSWGTDWGNEGYIFMARNGKNQCGITDIALYHTG